jgi:hypothetical protein
MTFFHRNFSLHSKLFTALSATSQKAQLGEILGYRNIAGLGLMGLTRIESIPDSQP